MFSFRFQSPSDQRDARNASPSFVEPLEARCMLSASVKIAPPSAHQLHVLAVHEKALKAFHKLQKTGKRIIVFNPPTKPGLAVVQPQATYSPVVGAYTPAQVRKAYGVSSLANQGQGMTIGIVDEFDDPNIGSDANIFSAQYGLPKLDGTSGDPTLTVVQDTALGSVTSASGTGVAGETCLDVEWAHAMAPLANIVLVEVPASGSITNQFAQLLHGVQVATQNGAQVVSLSYGYPEANIGFSNVATLDSTYLGSGTPASKVAVTVSSGDYSTPLYPATSPNVIAVGGSSLLLSSVKGGYSFETAWGGLHGAGSGGGGLSSTFGLPTFQSSNGLTYSNRAIPDVSLNADVITAVSTYDSLDTTTSAPSPWGATGGTSLSAPLFAGMLALAQQSRLAAGKAVQSSVQVNTAIYNSYNSSNYSTYFHDISLGKNAEVNSSGTTTASGYSATTGYDLATGVGSPIGNTFLQYLETLA